MQHQLAMEPTVLALLALFEAGHNDAIQNGARILRESQLSDGSWSTLGMDRDGSPWATALVVNALLLMSRADKGIEKGLATLVKTEPQEAFWLWRLKFRKTDNHIRFDPSKYGWGWVAGTVSWVIPTAMAVIALERSRHLNLVSSSKLRARVELGQAMLLDRICLGGGWNAGNSVVYGVALAPHIDATAIALAALRFHSHLPEVRQSLSWLLAADCSSAYSLAWKILALRGYADILSDAQPAIERARNKLAALVQEPVQVADTSTLALAILALSGSLNPFTMEGPQ